MTIRVEGTVLLEPYEPAVILKGEGGVTLGTMDPYAARRLADTLRQKAAEAERVCRRLEALARLEAPQEGGEDE